MGNARRAPYGSSKAAKTKNSPPKRQKSPPPPPPPQKFHPKNLGPLPNVTPADDLTDIVALANVLVALTAYIAFARRIGVLSIASLPLIGAGAGVLAGVSCIFFMNYDADKPGHTVYDGHTDKDNSCVRWATRGLWSCARSGCKDKGRARNVPRSTFVAPLVLTDAYKSMQRTALQRGARAASSTTQRLHSIQLDRIAIEPLATPLDIGCAGTAASPPDIDRGAKSSATSLA